MTFDLFPDEPAEPVVETPASGAVVLRRYARAKDKELMEAIETICYEAPLRRMQTPGGHTMSVAMTCCGRLGWVTDRQGYRYQETDPVSGKPWPAMPDVFVRLAEDAARRAGFHGFAADSCLVNRYERGAKMGLHQDRNEKDFSQPIVSVSLGVPVVFQFGGLKRNERPLNLPLAHGDVVVWGDAARLRYHGVLALKVGSHPLTGPYRYNLTFRRAG